MLVNNNSRKIEEVQSFNETFKIVPWKISRNLWNFQSWNFQLTSLPIRRICSMRSSRIRTTRVTNGDP